MDEHAEAEKKAQAEKERQEYILKEVSVRAAFQRELRRWNELVNPKALKGIRIGS